MGFSFSVFAENGVLRLDDDNFAHVAVLLLQSLPMSTTEDKTEEKVEGKKAGKDAPPVNIGWDSHNPVVCSSWQVGNWPCQKFHFSNLYACRYEFF